jgi:prolyl oligopeptidase
VPDPYRWLENPDTPATRAWVTAQNARTFAHLEKIPYRKSIGERLSALWNYEKRSAPSKEGGRYYFFRNDGLQNQSVLYASQTADGEGAQVVLDPNALSADGTVSVGGVYFSVITQAFAVHTSEPTSSLAQSSEGSYICMGR